MWQKHVAKTGLSAERRDTLNRLVSLKTSLRVWSGRLVNSVKIDGDGEAPDFENDEVENAFILSNNKNQQKH